MHRVLSSVFESFHEHGISYCMLRDADRLAQFDCGGEVDLLVASDELPYARRLLARLGFVSLPAWGHAPHHFFLAYDKHSDTWLKLDIVTEIAYGRPVHALRTSLAAQCLLGRRLSGQVFVPSADDELITLLLHCLLDKGRFEPSRQSRLRDLCKEIEDQGRIAALLSEFFGAELSWQKLSSLIARNEWQELVDLRGVAQAQLEAGRPFGIALRGLRDRLLRKLNAALAVFRPRFPSVALLAPDGAGKSTLAASLGKPPWLPVRSVYMGLYQKRATARSNHTTVPGFGMLGLLTTQWWRYLVSRYHRARGQAVIFDRYTYDAFLPSRRPLSWIKKWRRRILASACPAPDMVVMLDAPGEVLYARKGEHTPEVLEQQRQGYLMLRHYLPRTIVIDATRDSETVRREVTDLIWRTCAKRLGR